MNEDFDYGALTEQSDDEGLQTAYGVKPYDGRNFYVTLRLSDIRGSRFEECENPDTGEPEKGLFIPLRRSGVTVSPKKNVLATYKMEIAAVGSSHHSHLLRQVVDSDIERYWRGLGYKHEFDGFARPVGSKKKGNIQ